MLCEVHPVRKRLSGRVVDVRKPLRRPPDADRHHSEGFQARAAFHSIGDTIARLHVSVAGQKDHPATRPLDVPVHGFGHGGNHLVSDLAVTYWLGGGACAGSLYAEKQWKV